MDTSNFGGMETILYPVFQDLLLRNSSIIWIAHEYAKEQLLAIGIAPEAIVSDTQTGVERIKR